MPPKLAGRHEADRPGPDHERPPAALEATAYFIVAEALTNTVKHAHPGSAQIAAVVDRGVLRLVVRDDGAGGARSAAGRGCPGSSTTSAR
jgi:signal transduction histidine kinase